MSSIRKSNNPFLGEDSIADAESGDLGQTLQNDLDEYLTDLLTWKMPFGRYKEHFLDELPYEYLHWFNDDSRGFPTGRLGELMEFVYHTKSVGAEGIFSAVRERRRNPKLRIERKPNAD
ncbi:MAG: DUF3820 family protein [Verrucomicrobiota bacterium]